MSIGDLKTLFTDVSTELGLENGESFIEKDYFMTKIIHALSDFQSEGIRPVFCGGTSLSKCFGLIERFSEDIDFRGVSDQDAMPSKGARSRFRNHVLSIVHQIDGIEILEDNIKVGGNHFKIDIRYPTLYSKNQSLRPHIQLEFSFTQPVHKEGIIARPAQSLINAYTNSEATVNIDCISPVETAADKLSALTWRVLKRDRASEDDDPAMVRHMHDLFSLKDYVFDNQELFKALVLNSHDVDNKTTVRQLDKPFNEALEDVITILETDKLYMEEYTTFVEQVSFAASPTQFDEALENLNESLSLFKDNHAHNPGRPTPR